MCPTMGQGNRGGFGGSGPGCGECRGKQWSMGLWLETWDLLLLLNSWGC